MLDADINLLKLRHSVRAFQKKALAEDIIKKLKSELIYINSHEAGLNFQLCINDDSPFRGFGRSYGMFHNVNNYLACIIDPSFEHALERAGFFAEKFVLECTSLGIGTCFVGGTFSSRHAAVNMEVYEKLPFVVALGYGEEQSTTIIGKITKRLAHRKEMTIRNFYDGDDKEYEQAVLNFPWLTLALEAVKYSPSALNKQPVRLKMINRHGSNIIIAYTLGKEKQPVDLGIAKCNVASVINGEWEWGEEGAFIVEKGDA